MNVQEEDEVDTIEETDDNAEETIAADTDEDEDTTDEEVDTIEETDDISEEATAADTDEEEDTTDDTAAEVGADDVEGKSVQSWKHHPVNVSEMQSAYYLSYHPLCPLCFHTNRR